MALSTAIIKTVSGAKKSKVLPTKKFWAHSIAVGVSAKLLAQAKDVPIMEREEYFISGLLHDLGKVPFGDEYIEVLKRANEAQIPLIEAERELMAIDHQEVGMMIAEKWKLNEAISACVGNHHSLDKLEGEQKRRSRLFPWAMSIQIFMILVLQEISFQPRRRLPSFWNLPA